MQVGPTKTAAMVGAAVVVLAAAVGTSIALWPEGGETAEKPPPAVESNPTSTASTASTESTASTASTEAAVETLPPTTSSEEVSAGLVAVSPESTLVASFASDAPQFNEPDGAEVGEVPASWHGRPSVLPVIDQRPGWVQVRLAQRPNGSTAWVRRGDVTLAETPYRVEIDVATTRLRLFESGVEILDAPVGIGTDEAPSNVGRYFVAFVQEPPNTTSGWGPFVIVTSSHSETISDFQSSGDAIAAIHGPLGAAEKIGDTGWWVSHGCFRLHFEDLDALAVLPLGTPIDVIDSSRIKALGSSGVKVLGPGMVWMHGT